MLTVLVAHWSEALGDPRASARRILNANPTPGEAVAMALAAFALGYVAIRLIEVGLGASVAEALAPLTNTAAPSPPPEDDTTAFGDVSLGMLVALAQLVLVSALGWRIGALAGGSARFEQVFAIVGWHALATAPLEFSAKIVLIMSSPGLAAIGLIAMAAATFYSIYLLAAFLAEAHGFESVGQVLIAMIGVMISFMVVSAVLASFVQAAAAAP